jgi:thiol-disulfide isomerase/thioredoxin
MKVLKIGAIWCAGCLVMKPIWKKIEASNPWLKTEYFEYDDHPEVVEKYSLESGVLPTFIFLDSENNEILRISGEIEEKHLLELIEENKEK